jgi:hypothetical protein
MGNVKTILVCPHVGQLAAGQDWRHQAPASLLRGVTHTRWWGGAIGTEELERATAAIKKPAFTSIYFVEVRVGAKQPALPIVGLPVPKPACPGVACAQGWRNRRHQGHWGLGCQAARLRCNTVCIKLLLIMVSFHIMVLLIDDISGCFLSVLMRFGGVIGQFVFCVDRCLMPWFDLWLLFYVVGHIWFCLVDVHERIKPGSWKH